MLFKFEKFLVVKIAERVQTISREKCGACVNGLILDQLHSCQLVSLKEKIKMFLPRAKDDALKRLDQLFFLYQQSAWIDDERAHLETGEHLIEKLQPEDLLDRRYINEDAVREYPFNSSWLTEELSPVVSNMLGICSLPPILPLEQEVSKSRKRKKTQAD